VPKNVNFAIIFSKWCLVVPNFVFLDENFSTRKFSDSFLSAQKFRGSNYPLGPTSATAPLIERLCVSSAGVRGDSGDGAGPVHQRPGTLRA